MCLANERQQMVLAQRVQLDVLDHHHFTGIGAEQRAVGYFFQGLRVTATQILHGLGGALGGVQQTFARDVLAQLPEDGGVILFQCHRGVFPCGVRWLRGQARRRDAHSNVRMRAGARQGCKSTGRSVPLYPLAYTLATRSLPTSDAHYGLSRQVINPLPVPRE